jgi:hypothetical protein
VALHGSLTPTKVNLARDEAPCDNKPCDDEPHGPTQDDSLYPTKRAFKRAFLRVFPATKTSPRNRTQLDTPFKPSYADDVAFNTLCDSVTQGVIAVDDLTLASWFKDVFTFVDN